MQSTAKKFAVPAIWEYSAPLIAPEKRDQSPSCTQKDPSVIFHDGMWHVFMTIITPGNTPIEYCSFDKWENADKAPRTILKVSDSTHCCAPQVFYFTPHRKWYLIYQVRIADKRRLHVAYSTTDNINDPASWTRAAMIFGDGPNAPPDDGGLGGLDYWIICDNARAYLFFTDLKGNFWRSSTSIGDFPHNFGPCEIAHRGEFFEASHTYKLKGINQYLTIIEQIDEKVRRFYKAYLADSLDGQWTPLADTWEKPFAGQTNIRPTAGVEPWTESISHGELLREGADEKMIVDPDNLRFVFQGMLEKDKVNRHYSEFCWRIGMLTPANP